MRRIGNVAICVLLLALLAGCGNGEPYSKYAVSSAEAASAYSCYAALGGETVESVFVHYGYLYAPYELNEQEREEFLGLLLEMEADSSEGIDVGRYIREEGWTTACDSCWASIVLTDGQTFQVEVLIEPFLMINDVGFVSDGDALKDFEQFLYDFKPIIVPEEDTNET